MGFNSGFKGLIYSRNLILGFPSGLLPSSIRTEIMYVSLVSNTHSISRLPSFDHHNHISWSAWVMDLFVALFPASSCHYLSGPIIVKTFFHRKIFTRISTLSVSRNAQRWTKSWNSRPGQPPSFSFLQVVCVSPGGQTLGLQWNRPTTGGSKSLPTWATFIIIYPCHSLQLKQCR